MKPSYLIILLLMNFFWAAVYSAYKVIGPDLLTGGIVTLRFGLAAGAPAGATIDSGTGLFNWKPVAVGTNVITVIATDNGVPSLSDTATFTVRVLPQPQLLDVSTAGGEFTFKWFTLPGQNYQVEFKEDLSTLTWMPWGGPVAGNGDYAALVDTIAPSSPARFYRVRLVP